jgi:hypothetical protein
MPNPTSADLLRSRLKQRGVRLNTLHALFRLADLQTSGRAYQKEREQRILKCVAMLGGVREPDLVAISRLSQPTVWRLVERMRTSRAIRVVTDYDDHSGGRQAKWLQSPDSAKLPDGRRAYLIGTATLIKDYLSLWQEEQAHAQAKQAAEIVVPIAMRIPEEPQPMSQQEPPPAAPMPPPEPLQSPPAPHLPDTPAQHLGHLLDLAELSSPAPSARPPDRLPDLPAPLMTSPPLPIIRIYPPYVPSFERPDQPDDMSIFLWLFALKAAAATVIISVLITLALRFGVTTVTWLQAWAPTLFWIVAGSTLIGLVVWRGDSWWQEDWEVARRFNRGMVVLGLSLLLLPTGFARWNWTSFGPGSGDTQISGEGEASPVITFVVVPTPTDSPVLITPTVVPTPATCGQARIVAPRGLRLRATPGTTAPIIATLPQQTRLELLCDTQDAGGIHWAHVRAGAREGWVAAVEGAHQYLATP